MEFPHESDEPGGPGDGSFPETEPANSGADSTTETSQEGITPERLKQVIGRIETGFYDTPVVREHIARRIQEELDS